ncbi:MAG: DUF4870 domain-containing protein [Acidimicrobiia bacterium]|nr:MAG: DUF4870 domain-containing protein [Acidimicrobiia bacterium]
MTDQPASPPPVASESRGWAVAAHLLPWIGIGFFGPLFVWLIKRDEDPFVEMHARESLNLQISLLIYLVVSAILIIVFIGFLLILAVAVFGLVVNIIAAIKAANGQPYRYPLIIRFVSPRASAA